MYTQHIRKTNGCRFFRCNFRFAHFVTTLLWILHRSISFRFVFDRTDLATYNNFGTMIEVTKLNDKQIKTKLIKITEKRRQKININ